MYIQYQYKTNLFSVDRYVIKHFLQLSLPGKSGFRGSCSSSFRSYCIPVRLDNARNPCLPVVLPLGINSHSYRRAFYLHF